MKRLLLLLILLLAFGSAKAITVNVASITVMGISYNPMDSPYNAACDGAAADTLAFSTLIKAIGATPATIKMPGGKQCKVGTLNIPANVAVDYTEGGAFKLTTGRTLTVSGPQIAPLRQIFYDALAYQGTVSFAGNASVSTLPPEWWTTNSSPGTTDMTAAINAAIQAANAGNTIALTSSYLLSGSGAELLLVNKNVNLVGIGANGTFLNVAASVGGTVDVIHVNIAGSARFLTIRNLTIVPVSGHPARYGINLDVSQPNHALANVSIVENYIEQFGSQCIHLSNPIPNPDGFFVSQIQRNFLVGGISLQNSGDSNAIRDNTIAGALADIGIDISTVPGATKSIIDGNNITTARGAIRIQSGGQISIMNNNIEQVFTYRGSSNAMVDIAGSSGAQVIGTVIKNNTINALGKVTNLIRVDYAEHTIIEDNNLQKGTGSSITITANALNTDVRPQRWGTAEIAPSVMDLGRGTKGVNKTPTLVAGWVSDGTQTAVAKYWKDSANQVHFGGLIITTLNPPNFPVVLWTLPVGFRPATTIYLPITALTASGQAVAGYVRVTEGGAVSLENPNMALNDRITLDGVNFPAAVP